METILGYFIVALPVFGFIVGLVITVLLNRIARRNCRSLSLEYKTRLSSKSRSEFNVREILLTSFLTIAMWRFSWSIFWWSLEKYLSLSVPDTLPLKERWMAAYGVYIRAFSVYGLVLGLIPGLTTVICFYAVRKIAVAKVKSV